MSKVPIDLDLDIESLQFLQRQKEKLQTTDLDHVKEQGGKKQKIKRRDKMKSHKILLAHNKKST